MFHILSAWIEVYGQNIKRNKLLQISCVGTFGSNSYMYKVNGTANINAIRAAADQGMCLQFRPLPF